MTLIIYLFPELRTANNVVRWQTIPNTLEICTVAPLPYLLISVKELSWANSLLVLCKVLRLFANTLTVDYKYSLLSRDSLTQTIQMHLSKKENNFTNFSTFLMFSTCISEIMDCKKRV